MKRGLIRLIHFPAAQAAARIEPPPEDAKTPPAGDHDALMLWLAYKEAITTIKFDEKKAERVP